MTRKSIMLIALLIVPLMFATIPASYLIGVSQPRGITPEQVKMQEDLALAQSEIATLEEHNDRLQLLTRAKMVELSFYCDSERCTGRYTTTATGTIPTPGYTVAVDPDYIPLGSEIFIEGLGWRVAEDTGGAVNGYEIDVFMASHEEALSRGRYTALAIIKE